VEAKQDQAWLVLAMEIFAKSSEKIGRQDLT
jgi:hypothetical protein